MICKHCDRNIYPVDYESSHSWFHEHTGSVYCRYHLTGLEAEQLDRAEPK